MLAGLQRRSGLRSSLFDIVNSGEMGEREGKGEVKSRQRGHFHHHIFRDQIAASYLRKIAHLELLSPQFQDPSSKTWGR